MATEIHWSLCVTLRCDCDGFSIFILKEVGFSDSSEPNSAPYGNFWVISGALMKFVRIRSWPVSKILLINCAMQIKMCLITHQKFVRQSGFSVNIPTNWRQNCKCISLSWLLKACTTCNLYGWRLRSLCRMHRTLLSDMRKAWACLRADRLRQQLMDASTRALLSGVRTEGSRPVGFLHVTDPSSRHCLTHRWITFGDGSSCWFRSRWNPRWVSVIDPVRINSSTAHTRSLILPSALCWLNLKVTAHVQMPALRETTSGEARN